MGWQDAPLVGAPSGGKSPAWMNAPVVNAPPAAGAAPAAAAPPAAPQDGSSYDPNWKSTGNAFLDFMGRPRAKSEDPISALRDYGLSALDAATFGYGTSKLGLQSETAQAHANLGMMDPVAQGLGYAVGPGKVLGPLARAGLGAGVMGAVGEGAAAGGLGAAGHDENIAAGALGGGALGLAGGVGAKVIGAFGPKGAPTNPAADITQLTQQNKQDAYAALKNVPVPNMDDVASNARAALETADPGNSLRPAAPRTTAVLSRIEKRLAPDASQDLTGQDATDYLTSQQGAMSNEDYRSAWGDLMKTGKITMPSASTPQSAYDVLTSLDQLRNIRSGPPGPEQELAPILEQHLNDAMQNAGAGDLLQTAKQANKNYQNAKGLQQAGESLKGFGTSPAPWAQQVAESFYNDPSSPQYQALSKIANAAGGANAGQTAYGFTHGILHPLIEMGAFAALPPGLAPGAAAAATFLGAKPAIGAVLGARAKGASQRAMAGAYPTLTGQTLPSQAAAPDTGLSRALLALRGLVPGPAAGGFQ